MNSSEQIAEVLKGKIGLIITCGFFLGALSFVFFVTTQKHFKATSDILIVQNQPGFSDYYALSKSAEYLTNVLVESVYSEKFLDEVKNSNLVHSKFLPEDKLERLKKWEKVVKIKRTANLGILHVEVFGNNQKETVEISQAVIEVMTSKSALFLGNGQMIEARVMSGPLWQKNPSLSAIFAVIAGGFLMGVMLSIMGLYFGREKYIAMKMNENGLQHPV